MKTAKKTPNGFTDDEQAAMWERAEELRAERRGGQGAKANGESALLAKIAALPQPDRTMAERIHAIVMSSAPELSPRTWYGMPAYTNADGKVIVAFKNAGKFSLRYSTLEFQESAHLDKGKIWPVSFALNEWSPEAEEQLAELMKAAVS